MLAWPVVPALALGALVGAATAAAVGRATLRLTGFYFAMATLAFAEVLPAWGPEYWGPPGDGMIAEGGQAFEGLLTPNSTIGTF